MRWAVGVHHSWIIGVKILVRNGNPKRSAFALIHRQCKRGQPAGTKYVRPGRITNRWPSSLSVLPEPSMTMKMAATDSWGIVNVSPGLHVMVITSNSGTGGV